MSDTTETNWIEAIGKPAYESIAEMVAALECDYERLEELRDAKGDWEPEEVPHDFPVLELDEDDEAEDRATCGECGRSWDDAAPTAYTPVPSARCPFEAYHGPKTWEEANPDEAEELAALEAAAGDHADRDSAREAIESDALSVEVRSGWTTPGEPTRAWLEVQDWGKPWTQYFPADGDTLLDYAGCFFFGE